MNTITVDIPSEALTKASEKATADKANFQAKRAIEQGRPLSTVKNFQETPTREQVLEALTFVRAQIDGKSLSHDSVMLMFPLSDWPYHPLLHKEVGMWHRSSACSVEGLIRIFFEEHTKWLRNRVPNHSGPIPKPKSRTCPHCGKPI
jgi:hypothetical protein